MKEFAFKHPFLTVLFVIPAVSYGLFRLAVVVRGRDPFERPPPPPRPSPQPVPGDSP